MNGRAWSAMSGRDLGLQPTFSLGDGNCVCAQAARTGSVGGGAGGADPRPPQPAGWEAQGKGRRSRQGLARARSGFRMDRAACSRGPGTQQPLRAPPPASAIPRGHRCSAAAIAQLQSGSPGCACGGGQRGDAERGHLWESEYPAGRVPPLWPPMPPAVPRGEPVGPGAPPGGLQGGHPVTPRTPCFPPTLPGTLLPGPGPWLVCFEYLPQACPAPGSRGAREVSR